MNLVIDVECLKPEIIEKTALSECFVNHVSIVVLLFKTNDLSKDNEIFGRFGALHRGPSFALGQSTCNTEGLHCGLEAH